ncbi:PEP-CTERM sorting domain-containing protein [Marinobacter sediminum]|uniref:VPLPA-CTERM sorting domain-containing protein n=1 Tax=Marinobacter sediminum TaxID=256323 RepID=UPI00202EF9AE|nr:VPLPA-CTERM sorting domain-containing protein [Marinobacter sediminum]MCM0613137.1 PEP-CTERM sorting domain-containing protein [Marinobacter sediminum]
MKQLIAGLAALLLAITALPAQAELTSFKTFNGNVGLSTDGFGSLSDSGIISAEVPSGATVLGAYLYTATFGTTSTPTVEIDGVSASFGPRVPNATACCSLASFRADVTSLVAPKIDGGSGGIYDFDIAETVLGGNTDGSALVVVYELASLPESTVGLLDGFASVTGDTTSINFSEPLDPDDPGFFAEMRLGISFSCCNQRSRVEVNDQLLTENAGNFDDADGGTAANGRLFTMGGFDDAFSPINPTYAEDTERYDLSSFASSGDTSFKIDTFNASQDDNIFLAAFHVSGEAGINEPPPNGDPVDVPEPAGFLLLLTGLAGFGARRILRA